MTDIATWREVESKVYFPSRSIALLFGGVFLLVGGIAFVTIGPPDGQFFWFGKLFAAIFALFGAILVAWAVGTLIFPAHVRHAAPDVLPNVPREPVIREGAVVHGRLTHELYEDAQGWQFCPSKRFWRRNGNGLVYGFGIPFLVLSAGLVTWSFHDMIGGWAVSATFATFLVAMGGGTVFLIIALHLRAGYRRLSRLTIPRNGNDLELDSADDPQKIDLAQGLKWVFERGTKRHLLSIPRELVVAVQLCPWKYEAVRAGERERTWAVQGLLVLASSGEAGYHRLPFLLTCEFARAARLMQRLASALHVPYLFCADAEGWKAEAMRAENRSPLRIGGVD
jgi:hypothetical protein